MNNRAKILPNPLLVKVRPQKIDLSSRMIKIPKAMSKIINNKIINTQSWE